MRHRLALVAALLLVTAGCFGVTTPEHTPSPDPGPATSTPTATPGTDPTDTDDQTPSPTTAPAPPDPETDRLGWEAGYWYNESITVDRSNGLNDSELDAVVSRSMARVERIRELEFERRVPVEVISREQFTRNRTGRSYPTRVRLHQNTKWEAMFVLNESENAISTRESNTAATVGGFYSPSQERIVIVSENTTSPKLNEITLSQELFHALQDRHFNISSFDMRTQELHNAKDGLIEGDGNYVDYLYGQRCEAEWDCLLPQQSPGSGSGGSSESDVNLGMFAVTIQPYSSGPAFVQDLVQREGWEAVNDLYANPPASTEWVIHPETYGEDEPAYPTVEDTASDGWRVLDMGEGRIDYASFGEAGLAVMMWYPSFVESREQGVPTNVVVDYRAFFNFGPDGRSLQEIGPYNYSFPVTTGWDGDRLVPYVTDDSAATNQTGYVWKTNWDTEADAAEFLMGYEEILEYHGAESVEGRENVYRIQESEAFADAFYATQDGQTVTIVNAPTVEELGDVHAGAGTQ